MRELGSPLDKIKFKNGADSIFIDFIKRCLVYDPMKRMTPDEALRHSYLRNFQQY